MCPHHRFEDCTASYPKWRIMVRGVCERISARGNVFDLHRDDIAASQLAINGEIEHCQLARSPFDSKLRPNGPRLANSGGFAPISFPLFHGVRFGGGRIEFSFSMVILLECK